MYKKISAGGIANGGFVGDTGYAVVNEKQKKKSVGKYLFYFYLKRKKVNQIIFLFQNL